MDRKPEVFAGLLGWSNKRSGVEFYSLPDADNNGPRWVKNERDGLYGGWGALLADEIDPRMEAEGRPLHPAPAARERAARDVG
jgi:hypothetical protein